MENLKIVKNGVSRGQPIDGTQRINNTSHLTNIAKRYANTSLSNEEETMKTDVAPQFVNATEGTSAKGETEKQKRRRRRRKVVEKKEVKVPEKSPQEALKEESRGGRTIWRNIIWLVILFLYSFIGGLVFSAIEGGHDRTERLKIHERKLDFYENRLKYQFEIYNQLREIELDSSSLVHGLISEKNVDGIEKIKTIFEWYDKELGASTERPVMEDTKWNIWGGVYYAASLYTTIGYGNFHPNTQAGQILSMIYAFCGIPLVFTIMLEWGFLYFTWIEIFWKWFNSSLRPGSMEAHLKQRIRKEKFRRAGSELSLRSTSMSPLMHKSNKPHKDAIYQTDHQIESGKRIAQLEIELSEAEKQRTVPLKAALIFFFLWILISAFIVRLWETNWSYFTAYYYFFTSLTTIGLGDVVTETPNFIIFNLALTMVGLSVVGLCVAIVQAKIRLIFDRMIRSIDAQYRIRQIDPDVATMTLITDEKEGLKRLCEAQPLQDRIIYIAMDEHKKQLLEDKWKSRSAMINRITQTWPSRADKCIQTGQRVDEQPRSRPEGDYSDSWEGSSFTDEESVEYDGTGKRIAPPSNRRYIYTVFD